MPHRTQPVCSISRLLKSALAAKRPISPLGLLVEVLSRTDEEDQALPGLLIDDVRSPVLSTRKRKVKGEDASKAPRKRMPRGRSLLQFPQGTGSSAS